MKALAMELRESCVEAHNLVYRQTGVSGVGRVMLNLALNERRFAQPIHYALSNLAFFGSTRFGGPRVGMMRRLENRLSRGRYTFYAKICATPFQAFECVDASAGQWRLVGPGSDEQGAVHFSMVVDGGAELVIPRKGEVRAGWAMMTEADPVLLYSTQIQAEAARRLVEAAEEKAWFDAIGASHVVEAYERDLIKLILDGDYKDLGVGELFFIPARHRSGFAENFRDRLVQSFPRFVLSPEAVKKRNVSWWQEYARHDGLRPETGGQVFERVLTETARAVLPWGSDPVDVQYLYRVFRREEMLWSLGLDEEYRMMLGDYPALSTHPVHLLKLDDDFMKKWGLGPSATVLEARRLVGDDHEGALLLEEAIEAHQVRLRVVTLFRATQKHRERPAGFSPLVPDVFARQVISYRDLRKAIDLYFAEDLSTSPLRSLELGRQRSRIVKALAAHTGRAAEALRIQDLPEDRFELLGISGIGGGSVDAIEEGLMKAVVGYADRLQAVRHDEETRSHLEEGLDALEDLFG